MNIIHKVLLGLGLILSSSTFAGISIEPLVGYTIGSEINVTPGKEYNGGTGLGYGGKFAFENDKTHGLSFGLDYLNSEIDVSRFDKKAKTDDFGVYLGYKLPAFLKFYGEYIFASSGDTEVEGRHLNLSGTGFKIGAGATILPFIDLNLDYRQISYEKIDLSAFMFSVSWPIHLFDK